MLALFRVPFHLYLQELTIGIVEDISHPFPILEAAPPRNSLEENIDTATHDSHLSPPDPWGRVAEPHHSASGHDSSREETAEPPQGVRSGRTAGQPHATAPGWGLTKVNPQACIQHCIQLESQRLPQRPRNAAKNN